MSNNSTRLAALEIAVAQQGDVLARIEALVTGRAPKATTPKRTAKKAAPAPKARCLTRKNQQEFKAVHAWAKGLSPNAIAVLVVNGEQTLESGWAIGNGRTEKVLTGTFGTPSANTPKRKSSTKKAAKKAPAKRTRQAAKVEADAPAKERAADGPRNAKGHITPRSEWTLRESLADSGKFDRFEIDAIVASA